MPIKGLTEQLRLPRLGKIHLGVKKLSAKNVEYPTATDYFVCPPEVMAVFGEKPKSLPVYIPVEDAEFWASQYYRCYSQTRGLICKGDGEAYSRMIDVKTGLIAGKETGVVAWQPGACLGQECPIYQETRRGFPQCHEVMCLQFMLPDVPGVGVWQIDTGSINSIRNINSEATIIRQVCGRVNMLPLNLTLEPGETNDPATGKKQTHFFLHLRERATLHDLLSDSKKSIYELLAPPVADLEEAARDIEELFGDGKPQATTSTPSDATKQGIAEGSGMVPLIEPIWLKETLEIIGWSDQDAIKWLAINLRLPVKKTLGEMLTGMPAEKLQTFSKKLEELREAAGK